MEEKAEVGCDVKVKLAEMEEEMVAQNKPNQIEDDLQNTRKVPSALNITGPAPAQLTIFYAGSVSVFDGITAEKVRELMLIAAAAAADKKKTGDAKNSATSRPPSPLIRTGSSALQNSSTAPGSPICKLQAEFPIARRHSLQRFLEKRRDRLGSNSPYPTSPATPVDDNAKTNPSNNASPGGGCFKQSAMVQEDTQPSSVA